jgi:thymidylate synthase (FAD)
MKIVNCSVVLRKVDGTELDIVNAARVSFHKESVGEITDVPGVVVPNDKDIKLINYLASHGHWTPFGHVNATFVIKAPLFVARQLGKHQVGLVWNEVSRRYVDSQPEFWLPAEWRGKPVNAKQGSQGLIDDQKKYTDWFKAIATGALHAYDEAIADGMAPEQARMILPQNMMTEWWWTGSLAAWSRVFNLRLDEHTQKETQDVCQAMLDALLPSFPNALPALMKG